MEKKENRIDIRQLENKIIQPKGEVELNRSIDSRSVTAYHSGLAAGDFMDASP